MAWYGDSFTFLLFMCCLPFSCFYSVAMNNLWTASARMATPAASGNGAIPKTNVSNVSGQQKYNT
jgi:hypothetical protein